MGGRIATSKAARPNRYATKLAKLEAQLTATSDAAALGLLAREFHMVGYELGHDVSAIISDPGLVDRATRGKVDANERAAAAYARVGNFRHALFHLYEGLDAFPGPSERERLVTSIAALLDVHAPDVATRLRNALAALPVVADEAKARPPFYDAVRRIKDSLDWDRLPRGA